jgi:uncharacterized protein (UPF0332 family)
MSFDWLDYISVATTLKSFGQDNTYGYPEAFYRAAIGRAYYAAFKKAEEFLAARPNFRKYYKPGQHSDTSHWDVIDDFGKSNEYVNFEFWLVYENLKEIKYLRQQADYHIPFRIWSNGNQIIVKNWVKVTDDAIFKANTVLRRITHLTKKYP